MFITSSLSFRTHNNQMMLGRGVQVLTIMITLASFGLARDLATTSFYKYIIWLPLFTFQNPSLQGVYFTRVSLGYPTQQFNVIIDTGSDLFWVNCPSNSSMKMNYYNLSKSVTGLAEPCPKGKRLCDFQINYYDGSVTSGFYARDALHYDAFLVNSSITLSTVFVFGCSTFRNSRMNYHPKIEGILGLSPGKSSLVSQLSSQYIAPNVFSLCLASKGDGFLILGQVVDPGIMYTPIISNSKYKVALESVAVSGKLISIDPRLFNGKHDTLIDSGSQASLLLVAEAFDTLLTVVAAFLNQSSNPSPSQSVCYPVSAREIFPEIRLNFRGGASMNFRPVDYLYENTYDGQRGWCINFGRGDKGLTVIGAPALRDKLVVHDLNHGRIGWVEHDCSKSVNVSQTYDQASGQATNLTWRMSIAIAAILVAYWM